MDLLTPTPRSPGRLPDLTPADVGGLPSVSGRTQCPAPDGGFCVWHVFVSRRRGNSVFVDFHNPPSPDTESKGILGGSGESR